MAEKNSTSTIGAYKEGTVSIICNTVLFGIKLWAGLITGSIALIADAWHTLSDSLSSIIVIIAAILSKKSPDHKHPFGHGRWEQIAALFIALLLGIIAYQFVIESIERLEEHQKTTFGLIAIIVTIISIVIKEGLAQYAFYIAKKSGNISIKADGWHHRTDALSSIVVLVGILCANYFWWMDSVLGIAIALFLFYATYEILKETITKILGEEPPETLIQQIKEIANQVSSDKDLQLHHFHIHNYVTHQELTFHIRLDGHLSIDEGHQIATNIETLINQRWNIDTTIHIEPIGYEHHTD